MVVDRNEYKMKLVVLGDGCCIGCAYTYREDQVGKSGLLSNGESREPLDQLRKGTQFVLERAIDHHGPVFRTCVKVESSVISTQSTQTYLLSQAFVSHLDVDQSKVLDQHRGVA